MIIKGNQIDAQNGRRPYELGGRQILLRHFVVRITNMSNPFKPHRHDQPELWYIIDGTATVSLDGVDHPVEGGDLIVIDRQVEHGLRTDGQVTWICLG